MRGSTTGSPVPPSPARLDGAAQHDVPMSIASTLRERFQHARGDPTAAVLEGFHALKHALRFGAAIDLVVSRDPQALLAIADQLAPDVAERIAHLVHAVPVDLFAALAPHPPATGVLALAARPAVDPGALLTSVADDPLILLQRPNDLGNIGAVVRVAAAAGAAGVLTTGRHDPWHPAALRGSAGLHFALPVGRLDAIGDTVRPIVALHGDGEPLGREPLPRRAIFAFGSERSGLDAEILGRAERIMAIPMRRGVSSLNLATAVAVVLYARGPADRL